MTVYLTHGNDMFDPVTTPRLENGVYDLTGNREPYMFDWCFAAFWRTGTRLRPGYIRLAANRRTDGRWHASEAHVRSLVTYAEWITDVFHMQCYVVKTSANLDGMVKDDREHSESNGRLKDRYYKEQVKHDDDVMYALELRWDSGHKADQLFTAISYTRFACYEYTAFARAGLDEFTPMSLLTENFGGEFVLKILHMPFIDYSSLFDYFGGKEKPQIDAEFGYALHDFAVAQLRNREWMATSATDKNASHYSYIKCAEFHAFFKLWRTDAVKMDAFNEAMKNHVAVPIAVQVVEMDEEEREYYDDDDADDEDEEEEEEDIIQAAVEPPAPRIHLAPELAAPVPEHVQLMHARLKRGMVLFRNPAAGIRLPNDLRIRFDDDEE